MFVLVLCVLWSVFSQARLGQVANYNKEGSILWVRKSWNRGGQTRGGIKRHFQHLKTRGVLGLLHSLLVYLNSPANDFSFVSNYLWNILLIRRERQCYPLVIEIPQAPEKTNKMFARPNWIFYNLSWTDWTCGYQELSPNTARLPRLFKTLSQFELIWLIIHCWGGQSVLN